MAKRGPNRRNRLPKFSLSETNGIGWHVTLRDPKTGTPRRHRFDIRERGREHEARIRYHEWLAKHLRGETREAAEALGVSRAVATRDWRMARAWLAHKLRDDETEG